MNCPATSCEVSYSRQVGVTQRIKKYIYSEVEPQVIILIVNYYRGKFFRQSSIALFHPSGPIPFAFISLGIFILSS
jgi:hypothetical protein